MLDALGLCKLSRRDGTLDGSVPLRVAQACVPLLEGNAFGWQIELRAPLLIERRLAGWSVAPLPAERDRLGAALRGALPRLRAQGFLGAAWGKALEQGVGWSEGGMLGGRLLLWTGLLVRPVEGVWLRVSANANRRNVRLGVETHFIADPQGFTPLVLDLTPAAPLRLAGEIATLAPVAPRATFERVSLDLAPEVGRAHGDFYDQAYFAAKKGHSTRKYRKLVGKQPAAQGPGAARCELIEAGPVAHDVAPAGPFRGPLGPRKEASAPGDGRLDEITFRNLVSFQVCFDGQTVAIEPDRDELERGAREVELRFARALGEAFQREHRGALWYLTKYFTPHPPGEAHFFVKPWSFVRTPPGWSSLVDGVHGAGYDVLRGVISTDLFHATPAVFWLHQPGKSVEIPRDTPLIRVTPVPRWLLAAGHRERTFLDAR